MARLTAVNQPHQQSEQLAGLLLKLQELTGGVDAEASDPAGPPPDLLWSVLELCSGLPLLELADRVEEGSVVREEDAGEEGELAEVVSLRPQPARRVQWKAAPLARAADDGVESWT